MKFSSTFSDRVSYAGILGVSILWVGVGSAMVKAHLGFIDARPISYLGIDSRTSQLFSLSLLVSAILFILFGFWVRRTYHVPLKFLVYLIIGQVGQMIAAVTPYGHQQPQKLIHTVAAFVLAFSLPFLMREFVRSQIKSPDYNLFKLLLRIEQFAFVIGIGLFIFTEGIAPLGEALPTAGFHAWILVITYLAIKKYKRTGSL